MGEFDFALDGDILVMYELLLQFVTLQFAVNGTVLLAGSGLACVFAEIGGEISENCF